MKKLLFSLLATCLLANSAVGQEWIRAFDKYKALGVWDGQVVRTPKYLARSYKKECDGAELYVYEGHLYAKEELLKALPKPPGPASQDSLPKPKRPTKKTGPLRANQERFLWVVYCRGLEADLKKGLIVPDPNCARCKGDGQLVCVICEGKRFLVEEVEQMRVLRNEQIRPLRKQVNVFRREANLVSRRANAARARARYIISDSEYQQEIRRINNAERQVLFGPEGIEKDIESVFGQIERLEQSPDSVFPTKRVKRRIRNKCRPCHAKGVLGCPKCVLLNKPNYKLETWHGYPKRWARVEADAKKKAKQ